MTIRRLLFWAHLATGVAIALVVALLATTGALLVFQTETIAWFERNDRIVQPQAGGCVAPSALLTAAESATGQHASTLAVFADPHQPAEVAFGHDTVLLMDACRGTVVDRNAGRLRGFFWQVRELHRAVALRGVAHESLRAIKNAANLAFLFLIVSGLVLWIPRKLRWTHIKAVVLPRGGLKSRARDWNLHNVAGFWMALPLLLVSATGVIMSYPWANALLYRAAGDVPPARQERTQDDNTALDPSRYPLLDGALAAAMHQAGTWKSLEMRIPGQKNKAVLFTADAGDGGQPQQRMRLQVNRKTAAVTRIERFTDNTRGRRWRLYARFLHTGELFGTAGKAVALLASAAALLLVWTGLALGFRRWRSWREQMQARATALPL